MKYKLYIKKIQNLKADGTIEDLTREEVLKRINNKIYVINSNEITLNEKSPVVQPTGQ